MMIGYAYLSLQDAEKILIEQYKQEYEKFTDFEIQFGIEEESHFSRDWDGSYEYYKTNEIYALINLKRKIGDIVTSFKVKKDRSELTNDLLNRLKELYQDEDFTVSDIYFPSFKNKKIDLKEQISLSFESKKHKNLEMKIG